MSRNYKKRSENWTREERDVLLEIIKSYRHILDSQNNNANTNKMKNVVWNHVSNKFNEISHTNRNVNQLKSFWKRLKLAARKKARMQSEGKNEVSSGDDSSNDGSLLNNTFENCDSRCSQICGPTEVVLLAEPQSPKKFEDEANCQDVGSNINGTETKHKTEHNHNYKVPINVRFQKRIDIKEKSRKRKSNIRSNCQSQEKIETKELMLKRYYTKLYHQNNLRHQNIKHRLEIENLLLEKKKNELELEISKRKLELLTSSKIT